ncbi:hypothetical protein AAGW05_10230 [Arthrobacter sp. LAPM80]|uniref:hypothetical protein n=1 Tax=Arthrobacter sp. LAPM80 TaxID=3141788 RepID=UPI00398AAE08
MTELLDGTEFAGVQLPEDVVGFGFAEVAYLLGRHDSVQADMLRAKLILDQENNSEATKASGLSSLVARGWVAARNQQVQSRSAAALLEYVGARGGRWTTMGIANAQQPDLALVVESAGLIAMLQPRAYGTWFAGFSSDESPAGALLTSTLRERVRGNPATAMYFVSETLGQAPRSVFVRRDHEQNKWDAVLDADGPGTGVRKLVDDAGLDLLFAAFLPARR